MDINLTYVKSLREITLERVVKSDILMSKQNRIKNIGYVYSITGYSCETIIFI